MITLSQQAEEALTEKRFEDAVDLFTKIIDNETQSTGALLGRAKAHSKLGNHAQAAEDANQATAIDPKLVAAYHEQGKALYSLDQFESAKEAFEMASSLEPNKKIYQNWVGMCLAAMGKKVPMPKEHNPYEENDDIPHHHQTTNPTSVTIDDPEYAKYWTSHHPKTTTTTNDTSTTTTITNTAPAADAPKYRHQWFQNPHKVEVNIMAKGLTKDQVTVTIQPDHLYVAISTNANRESSTKKCGTEYELDIQLYSTVNVDASRYAVLGTKIEIHLFKDEQGKEWSALDASGTDESGSGAAPMQGAQTGTAAASAATKSTAAVMRSPYAGKAGQIDWDGIAADDDTEAASDDITEFFRKLYSTADSDTKRAMMKSFQESGGTALNTNWGEVESLNYGSEKGAP